MLGFGRRLLEGEAGEASIVAVALTLTAVILVGYVSYEAVTGQIEGLARRIERCREDLRVVEACYVDEGRTEARVEGLTLEDGSNVIALNLGLPEAHVLTLEFEAGLVDDGYSDGRLYLFDYRSSSWILLFDFRLDGVSRWYGPVRVYNGSGFVEDGRVKVRFEFSGVPSRVYLSRLSVEGFFRRSRLLNLRIVNFDQSTPASIVYLWMDDGLTRRSIEVSRFIPAGGEVSFEVEAPSEYVYRVKIVSGRGRVYTVYVGGG